jgi:hypothetical protein
LPLDLADDPLIPEDLRMAYRILKNAGLVPEEVTMLREVAQWKRWCATPPARRQTRALRRLELVRMRLDAAAPGRAALPLARTLIATASSAVQPATRTSGGPANEFVPDPLGAEHNPAVAGDLPVQRFKFAGSGR